jgi:hypothetical protein
MTEMFAWLKSICRRSDPPRDDFTIKTDPQALALIDEYRRRFSSAPIGMWVDCYDEFMGSGFGGVSGKFGETVFLADGTGRSADEYETTAFEWRPVSHRVIEVRCVERIPGANGGAVEKCGEHQPWQRVEYDFVVPRFVNVPTIFDATAGNAIRIAYGTINPFVDLTFLACLDRVSGTLRLHEGDRR